MKTVILDFHTDEQAEKFFRAFSGRFTEEERESNSDLKTSKVIDELMLHCEVGSVHTKEEDAAYTIDLN
jgi:hypothetical protein